MNRIKQIIEAMKTLSDEKPSARIREAWAEFSASTDGADDNDRRLLERLIDGVVSIAEDMERDEAKKAQADRPAEAAS